MECRKTIIFLMITIFLFSIASVSASDVNDTVIAFEDTSQNELSDCNESVTDNLKASEENNIDCSAQHYNTFFLFKSKNKRFWVIGPKSMRQVSIRKKALRNMLRLELQSASVLLQRL